MKTSSDQLLAFLDGDKLLCPACALERYGMEEILIQSIDRKYLLVFHGKCKSCEKPFDNPESTEALRRINHELTRRGKK